MGDSKKSVFTNWIFNTFEVTDRGLALYRIFVSLYILFYLLPSTGIYDFISSVPPDFFAPPPGPFSLLSGFPPGWLLFALHYVLVFALLCMLIGYFTKAASLVAGLMLFFLKGFMFGLGKIDHELLMIVVPILMAFSGWGKAYSVDTWRNAKSVYAQSWVLTLLALITGFMFFTAGFPKILGGWLDLSTHATEGHFYKQYFVRGREDLLANFALLFPDTVWEILDYATIIFEIGFLAAIVKAQSTRIFICLAVFFHFSIMMIMNIPFLPNFVAYAAFVNWTWVDRALRTNAQKLLKNPKMAEYVPPVVIAVSMTVCFILLYSLKGQAALKSDLTIYAVVLVPVFTAMAAAYLCKVLYTGVLMKKT